jgi:hypothetical protein
MRFAFGLALTLTFSTLPALAAPPVLRSVSPRGLPRGHQITLTLTGSGVGLGSPEVIAALPGTLGPLKTEEPDRISVAVSIAPDAPVGLYPLQVRTADGLTSRELVIVDDLPETAENEPNDELTAAQEVSLPVTIQGSCSGTDRDHFRFSGKKGETIVVEVEAKRLGSGLDPIVAILDATGHALADEPDAVLLGGDPRLFFTLPQDGTYVIELNDLRYSGGGDPFYRLKLNTFLCADAVFPLGWRRGESVEALFLGGNLPTPLRTKITLPIDSEPAWTLIGLPASPVGGTPFRMVMSDDPEQLEPDGKGPHPWSVGTIMNGRISEPGEVDRYTLPVKPGQALVFSIDAALLGSRLDAVVRLAKPDGSALTATDNTKGYDPRLPFTVPDGVTELVVSVEDLLGRGGVMFAYRLKAQPLHPDFTLQVAAAAITIPKGSPTIVPVRVERQNFKDSIQLSIPSGLTGISASGGQIAAGATEGSIVLTADPDVEPRLVPLEIWGEGGPAAQPVRRRARLASDGTPQSPLKPYTMTAAIGNGPPVTLTASASSLTLLHGQTAKLVIKAKRPPGNKESITLTTVGVPTQVAGGRGKIDGDKDEVTLEFVVESRAPTVRSTLLLTGKTRGNGREETIVLPPIVAEVKEPYSLEILTTNPTVPAGGKTKIIGVLRRLEPFDEPVTISVEGSPHPHISVEPVTLAKGEALAQVEIATDSEAKPETVEIMLRASSQISGRKQTKDYIIPDVPVRVTITPAATAPVVAN